MVLLLVACAAAPSGASDRAGDPSGGGDTSDTSQADTGDIARTEVEPGPDCVSDEWPVATPFNVLAAQAVAGTLRPAELADLHTVVEEWAPAVAGPWSHAIVGPYLSSDGVTFAGAETVLDRASVPDVVPTVDGWFMVYVDGDLDALLSAADAGTALPAGLLGFGGLAAQVSVDGVVWSPVTLEFAGPVPTYAVDPELQALPDGRWALYFYGIPAAELCGDAPDPFLVPGPHRLYRAESDDLVRWSEPAVVWQNPGGGTDPAVWCSSDLDCIGWFSTPIRSDDGGQTWEEAPDFAMAVRPQIPDVVRRDAEFRMIYGGSSGLEAAVSADGLAWTAAGVLGIGYGSPTVAQVEGDVWLWVSGGP